MTDFNTRDEDEAFALRIDGGDHVGKIIGGALEALRLQSAALIYQQQVLTTALFARYADQTGVPAPAIPEGGWDLVTQIVGGVVKLAQDGNGPVTDGTFTLTNEETGDVDPVEYPITWAGLQNAVAEQTEGVSLGFKAGPDGAYATRRAKADEILARLEASEAFERTFGTPVGQA